MGNIPKIYEDLLTASQEGIHELVQVVADYMSMPIVITNPHYHLITFATPSKSTVNYTTFSIDNIISVNGLEFIYDSNIELCEITIDDIVYTCWKSTIIHNHKTLGFVFYLNINNSTSIKKFIPFIRYVSMAFITPLQKKEEILNEKKKYLEPFLFDLLYGNFKNKEEIIEQGKVWDFDFTLPQQTIVFSLSDFHHISLDNEIIETMNFIIKENLQSNNITPITMTRKNKTVVILTINMDDKHELDRFINNFCNKIRDEMKTLYPDRTFVCGVGKKYDDPTNLFRSFQEAKVALKIGEKLNISTPFFEALGIERILYNHDSQSLKEFFDSTLGELIHYDEENNMELFSTLEAFCNNQFDITATSKALYLHRNTLRYRLNKIEEILDLKLDDWNNKLKIAAAFKIKQLGKI